MIHYQINLRSICNEAPGNPLEAIREWRNPRAPRKALHVLAERVGDFRELGVELLHVMPPFLVGMEARKGIGSPYAIRDPYKIDPEYGTLDDWYEFVRAAHQNGMKVMMGYVPNHTARDHVWLQEHPEFFERDDAGKPSFDFDWSDTAKLDYTRPALRAAVTDVLHFWIRGACDDSGVDGFRMDMAHMLSDLSFWNESIPSCRACVDRSLLFLAECYGRERNVDLFDRGFDAAYDDDLYKVAQYGFARDADGNSVLHLDRASAEGNGDFAAWLAAWNEGGIAAAVRAIVKSYADYPAQQLARYVDNHDEGRGGYRFGPQAAKAMMDLIAWLPQTMVFQLAGQESGALNRPPIHEHVGLCDKGFRRVTTDGIEEVAGIEFTGNLFFRTTEERLQCFSEHRNRNLAHWERGNTPVHFLNVTGEDGQSHPTVLGLVCGTAQMFVNLSHESARFLCDGVGMALEPWETRVSADDAGAV